jgi:alkaline phosphatase
MSLPLAVVLMVAPLIGAHEYGGKDAAREGGRVRFALTADCHLMGRRTPGNERHLLEFVAEMARWKPDFVIDLGDFACQAGEGQTTAELHDAQLQGLIHHWSVFSRVPCPAYLAMGNHDVGWLHGGDEKIEPADLYAGPHGGEDITKQEYLAATRMPGRYYSFDVRNYHFIVLDANNARDPAAVAPGHDGVAGGYFVDGQQMAWLEENLAAHRGKTTVVFCHQELHHTPPEGSGEGGDVPFAPVGKENSYVDNGWQLREIFKSHDSVVACFFGHKHRNRWTVYGGVHYITLAATHWGGSYAKVTISDKLSIRGHANQRDYTIPLQARVQH